MGNHHKFSLSYMIPNAWLHKLKSLATPKPSQKHHRHESSSSSSSSSHHPQILHQRKSYHFRRDIPKQECFSDKKRNATVLAGCGCPVSATVESVISTKPPPSATADNSMLTSSPLKQTKIQFASLLELKLTPIRTNVDVKSKEQQDVGIISPRRLSVGLKLRTSSPRIIGNKKLKISGQRQSQRRRTRTRKRKSLSESFVVVKSSADPRRDFMESMVEMIVENNIRGSKELEELLVCYLSLNSSKYHDLIIGVFQQLWFEFADRC